MSYYKDELDRIKTDGEFPAMIQVSTSVGCTKWMSLNEESANDLRTWLDERFPVVVNMEKMNDEPVKKGEIEWDFNTKKNEDKGKI